jgi:hypothetical protein
MSMEIWVLSDRRLKSTADWQTAIDAERYPLQLSSDVIFGELRGFFPMQLRGERSGCECYHDPADELLKANPKVDFGHAWKYALGFRWGGNLKAMQAAWMAATAYAAATNGIVVDDQELKIRSPEESRREVDDIVQGIPKMEEIIRNFKASLAQRDKPSSR